MILGIQIENLVLLNILQTNLPLDEKKITDYEINVHGEYFFDNFLHYFIICHYRNTVLIVRFCQIKVNKICLSNVISEVLYLMPINMYF